MAVAYRDALVGRPLPAGFQCAPAKAEARRHPSTVKTSHARAHNSRHGRRVAVPRVARLLVYVVAPPQSPKPPDTTQMSLTDNPKRTYPLSKHDIKRLAHRPPCPARGQVVMDDQRRRLVTLLGGGEITRAKRAPIPYQTKSAQARPGRPRGGGRS